MELRHFWIMRSRIGRLDSLFTDGSGWFTYHDDYMEGNGIDEGSLGAQHRVIGYAEDSHGGCCDTEYPRGDQIHYMLGT
jgi:hypothetical protein